MVRAAQVLGGSQPAEVACMLGLERAGLKTDREWLDAARRRLQDAAVKRDDAFARLKVQ